MYLKLVASLVFFALSIGALFCQNTSFGLTGNIGLSKVNSNLSVENKEDNLVLSGNVGFLFEKIIRSKSGFGAKLLWVPLKGETEVSDIELFTINPETFMREVVGSRTTLTSFQSNYIGVPIYYFFKQNKLKINTGIQPMFLLNTKSRFKNNIIFEGEASESEGENSVQFNKLDLGITLGLSYDLTDKLSIASSFYYGLLNVDKQSSNSERKNRQITLGLNYYFLSKN